MSMEENRAHFDSLKSRLQYVGFNQLKTRLDLTQLERTITALYQSLPEDKASDAAATLRRMFDRAKRWEA